MGWFIEELPGVGQVVSVGGDVDGYVGELVFAPQRQLGTMILVNSGDAPPLPFIGRWLIAKLQGETNSSAAAEARYYRGMIDQATGKWASAVDAFSSLANHTPPHLRALYQIGRTAVLSGEHLDQGTRALEEYLRHDPLPGISHAAAYWRLGQVHERAERWDAATAAYQEALEREAHYEPARAALRELRKRKSK
jgi:tetratricopeptide (TPR) repeat protein